MADNYAPCPGNWEYEDVANYNSLLTTRSTTILRLLRSIQPAPKAALGGDTRPLHTLLFQQLTPEHFPYFAGHYRGERLRCLVDYEVGIAGDRRVGHPAATVPMEMASFATYISRLVVELDFHYAVPNRIFSPELKLLRAIELAAAAFVYFLEIHPFANGNGHMARLMLQALLGRHNIYFNAGFGLHPRPKDPQYSDAIKQYRNGNKVPLHVLLMGCL